MSGVTRALPAVTVMVVVAGAQMVTGRSMWQGAVVVLVVAVIATLARKRKSAPPVH